MKKVIIANWKCNPITTKEGKKILEYLSNSWDKKNQLIICPPSIYLSSLMADFGSNFKFGVQNCYFEEKGAYTGEISFKMAENMGSRYVIIGHSERKLLFKETDEDINMKMRNALDGTKLTPILCIGENREERENEKTYQILAKQITDAFYKIQLEKIKKVIIAYEPIWAIGTGIHATEDKIIDAKNSIIKILCDIYGEAILKRVNIVYGGSVSKDNIDNILNKSNMDGVLVGGASLNPKDFTAIINS